MERQNITLSLTKSLLKKAKAVAARKEKSLSEFLRESLEEKVRESTGYKKAMDRQLKLMKKGFDLGIKERIEVSRKEIHERR
jgi:metal-responsive CopG/Arc/MetJ family transcriptional regulator